MGFRVATRPGTAGDRSGEVYELADAAGTVRAEVWPFAGFNCLRWQQRRTDGTWGDGLYVAPDWETNPVPTRSGHPVLWPFPNRLKAGELQFGDRTIRLPLNDSAKANAIHGFAPRVPWRVTASGADATSAFVTGQVRIATDVPDGPNLWPGDGTLTLTYRLTATTLRVEAVVENAGPEAFPFGLGYHPYFRLPVDAAARADEMVLATAATTEWVTDNGVPTGEQIPVPAGRDFRTPRMLGGTTLDHLFGTLKPLAERKGLHELATLSAAGQTLGIWADSGFRELVLFTPVHRTAVAIEPYTCATDAAHLPDAGWRVLAPGERFEASVEYRWQ